MYYLTYILQIAVFKKNVAKERKNRETAKTTVTI